MKTTRTFLFPNLKKININPDYFQQTKSVSSNFDSRQILHLYATKHTFPD